jgi:CRP/FNR family cyclic AMP-dependent transcriptional regulator
MDEKLALLAKVPLLAGLGRKGLEEVGRLADEIDVNAGKVLTREGAIGKEFFVIVDGTITISRGGQHLRDLGAGEFFGELALLGNVPRTATATAETPARLLVVGHREFTTLLSDQPTVRTRVFESMASYIATLTPDRAC